MLEAKSNDVAGDAVKGVDKVKRYGWEITDDPGELIWVDKGLLKIDHDYQRENVVESKVLRIASKWSWVACGALIVAQRKGVFYVMDGQYRLTAAMRRSDIRRMPCVVFGTVEKKEEAQGFLAANTERKPITSLDKFKAQLVLGDEVALLVDSLIAQSGRVPSSQVGPGKVKCLTAMMKAAQKSPELLERVWPVAVAVCRGHALNKYLLEAFLYIEQRLPEGESLTKKRWQNRLVQIGYEQLVDETVKAAAYYEKGGARVWADGILKRLNKRLHDPLVME